MQENYPLLISCKTLEPEYENVKKIAITSENFTLGRGLQNDVVIPFLAISRKHCVFRKSSEDVWTIQDFSAFGIEINRDRIGKGMTRTLSHEDVIVLEPSKEFIYKFVDPASDDFEIPRKRIKLDDSNNGIINDVKIKFDQSQSFEMKHMEEKIQSTQQMQTTSLILKQQLQSEMNRKMLQLETDYALQIENLNGEKNEVENQKATLIEERDALLATIKAEMGVKIADLMDQIKKLNDTESELLNENSSLKEKLLKEREEFLSELSRENSSKQDMMEKLQAKIKEQEEIRLKEKQELEMQLRKETEQLRLAKEKELKELENEKQQKELELVEELNKIKRKLEEHVEQTDKQKVEAEQQLNEQMEQIKKLSDEEKVRMEQLVKEREEMQNQLTKAETNALESREKLRAELQEREVELAALAAERIQKQAEQTGEVITSLQDQLEQVRLQLQLVESEKNILLENRPPPPAPSGEGSSRQATVEDVGDVVESELQCSICGELFVAATTLGCSHTFCKYCITTWKKKKKDCPICRAPITSECKSLVLDSFIEKMANMTEETKIKRQELLKSREELGAEVTRPVSVGTSRGGSGTTESNDTDLDSEDIDSEEREEDEAYDDYDEYGEDEYDEWSSWIPGTRYQYTESDTDSGSDGDSDSADDESPGYAENSAPRAPAPAGLGAPAPEDSANTPGGAAGNALSNNTPQRTDGDGAGARRRRRRERVPGLAGSYYGGYGRCYRCNARGHWAPGCPFR